MTLDYCDQSLPSRLGLLVVHAIERSDTKNHSLSKEPVLRSDGGNGKRFSNRLLLLNGKCIIICNGLLYFLKISVVIPRFLYIEMSFSGDFFLFSFQVIGSDHDYHFVHHALPHARTKRSVLHTRQLKADPLVSSIRHAILPVILICFCI